MPGTVDHGPHEPDDEDLSSVLANIGWGMLSATRANLANSEGTREFLEIGLGLLRNDLLMHTGPDFDEGDRSRLFESLSRERILKRAAERDVAQEKLLTVNMFRHRWERKDRYTEDLISYLFRLGPSQRHIADMEAAAEAVLATDISLRDLVESLAHAEMQAMMTDPLTSLQSIIQAALPNHPRVQLFIRAQYDMLLPRWATLYQRIANAYGLTLKCNYTWLDMATLFTTVIDGALVRARVDHIEPKLSDGSGILTGAILAMLPTLIDGLPFDCSTIYPIRR